MTRRHHRSLVTIVVAILLDGVGGVVFAAVGHLPVGLGLYWAVATATTVGYGDVTPRSTAAHAIAVLVMLSVIPLFAAAFSLITSGLAVVHVHSEGDRMRQRLDHVIAHHPDIPEFRETSR